MTTIPRKKQAQIFSLHMLFISSKQNKTKKKNKLFSEFKDGILAKFSIHIPKRFKFLPNFGEVFAKSAEKLDFLLFSL